MKHLKSMFAAVAVAAMMLPVVVAAQSPFTGALTNAQAVGATAHINSTQSVQQIIGNIINVVLGFLGVVFLALILYAGFLWMTANGEEKGVLKAKEILKQSIIGLIVIASAFAISNFVLGSLINVSGAA